MKFLPKCPHCGNTGINMLSDAWVVRSVIAVDDEGGPIAGSEEDVREFDHTEFECGGCGESLLWAEIEMEEAPEVGEKERAS